MNNKSTLRPLFNLNSYISNKRRARSHRSNSPFGSSLQNSFTSVPNTHRRNTSQKNPYMVSKSFTHSASKSLQLNSPKSSPQQRIDIFPNWLTERQDFQDTMKQFDQLEDIDICKVCEKSGDERTAVEQRALAEWTHTCPFFATYSRHTRLKVCYYLKTCYFQPGDYLMKENSSPTELLIIFQGYVNVLNEGNPKPLVTLGPNNTLGELSLSNSQSRNASVQAKTDVIAFSLSKEDYQNVLLKHKLKERYGITQFLRNIPFFNEWQISKLRRFACDIFPVQYEKGQIIFDYGEAPINLYIIKNGQVKLEAKITLKEQNSWPKSGTQREALITNKVFKRIIRVNGENEFFGERELILNTERDTRAICTVSGTTAYLIGQEPFNRLFSEKEKQQLLAIYRPRPTTRQLQEMVNEELQQGKVKIKAVIDAFNVQKVAGGRPLFEFPKLTRRVNWSEQIVNQRRRMLNKNLVDMKSEHKII